MSQPHKYLLTHSQTQGDHRDAEDRAHHKGPPHYLVGYAKQENVQRVGGY